jgi:signal transduction histidine kinase
MTILVVDDEAPSRTLLTAMLTEQGYQVRAADGGELALAAIARARPELILLDIRMPGMDGFEVCRLLKSRPDTQDIPLMFITASGELEEKVEGLRLGAVDFVTKPFQREELLARVRTHLELGRLRAHLEEQVEKRTAELAAVNEDLKREILERRRAEEMNRTLAGRLITSQEVERARIARDLHDGVSQDVAAAAIWISRLQQKGSDIGSVEAQEILVSVQHGLSVVSETLHTLSHDLHPSILQRSGLATALRAHCAEVERLYPLKVTFEEVDAGEPASRLVSLSLFRIAQEALRNTARHGEAHHAIVSLERKERHLRLRIVDDGRGFDAADADSKRGLGVVSMKERARLVQGQFFLESLPACGTTIEVRVPVEVADELETREQESLLKL